MQTSPSSSTTGRYGLRKERSMTNERRHPVKSFPAMGALSCIIVEDNNKQSALLKDYIAKTPHLTFSGKCDSAPEVFQLVAQSRAEIIFWDIRLLDNPIMLRLKESGYYPI